MDYKRSVPLAPRAACHPAPHSREGPDLSENAKTEIVCVSHLWWDWVWQRPQQLLSRIAERHRVLYVEEPRIEIGEPYDAFDVVPVAPGVDVARLTLRADKETFWRRLEESRGTLDGHPFAVSKDIRIASLMFNTSEQGRLERAVEGVVRSRRSGPLVLWLYTPLAIHFIDLLKPDLVVYDVMDDLTAFRFAPPALLEQERQLLTRADVVLAGGPSLHASKVGRRPDTHLFPSGVDEAHFAQALDPALPAPDELADVRRPVVGFYGVVDERTDLELLEEVARLRPDWGWVMVGPVLKIHEDRLPRAPNLRYVGKQPYEALPTFLKSFDVAMMPFALNEATRSISPTKTLEYMAAHKPIVSTPVPDVVDLYGSVVRFASTAEGFVAQVEAALAETDADRREREKTESRLLARYSWDRIASEIDELIGAALEARAPAPA